MVSRFPDDLKPPIGAGLNSVVDRRCGALADHCLDGTLGVLAQCETGNSGVHRLLLLKTTTPHTLLSAAQSIRDCVVSLCHWVVNAGCTGRYPSGPLVPAVSRAIAAFERRDFSAAIDALEPIAGELER